MFYYLPPLFLVYISSALLDIVGLLSIPESFGELNDSDSEEVLRGRFGLRWLSTRLAWGGDFVCDELFWFSSARVKHLIYIQIKWMNINDSFSYIKKLPLIVLWISRLWDFKKRKVHCVHRSNKIKEISKLIPDQKIIVFKSKRHYQL